MTTQSSAQVTSAVTVSPSAIVTVVAQPFGVMLTLGDTPRSVYLPAVTEIRNLPFGPTITVCSTGPSLPPTCSSILPGRGAGVPGGGPPTALNWPSITPKGAVAVVVVGVDG